MSVQIHPSVDNGVKKGTGNFSKPLIKRKRRAREIFSL